MSNAKPPKTLDIKQQQQLLDAILKNNAPPKTCLKGIRNHLMACLMLDAGLRVGEVVALKKSHLYFNDRPVETLVLTPSITKNHRERTVRLSERLKKAIEEFYASNTWLRFQTDTYPVWCDENHNRPLTTRQVENIINSAANKAFGRRINPHMLRHTFASGLMRVTNIRTVQELLGHNYVTSTQIYTHPNEDDKKKAIEDLQRETNLLGQDLEDLAGLGP